MKWVKKGLIFKPDDNPKYEWMRTHAQIPLSDKINGNRLRIYFGTRDRHNRTLTTYIEVEADNPQKVLYQHDKPILPLGRLGTFDDSGAMPSCIVNHEGKKYLYYIGWNVGTTVPYRNAIGLAVSDDGGQTFRRLFEGPVMDRTHIEPYLVVTPYVRVEKGTWKMWYCGGTGWTIVKGKPEPLYQIKYAESKDGIKWVRNNIVCIDYKFEDEANTRPCVIKENGIYKMWYCYRGSLGYREDKGQSYRIGYAESADGINWVRKDKEAGIDVSESGWDSEMIAYPFVYEHKGKKYLLYNGNGFGTSGFGYAVLEK